MSEREQNSADSNELALEVSQNNEQWKELVRWPLNGFYRVRRVGCIPPLAERAAPSAAEPWLPRILTAASDYESLYKLVDTMKPDEVKRALVNLAAAQPGEFSAEQALQILYVQWFKEQFVMELTAILAQVGTEARNEALEQAARVLVEKLKPLLEKATPRPWNLGDEFAEWIEGDKGATVCEFPHDNGPGSSEQFVKDATLIVAAVNAIDELAAILARKSSEPAVQVEGAGEEK